MQQNSFTLKKTSQLIAILPLAFFSTMATSTFAAPDNNEENKPFLTAPLLLKDMGSFYIGGVAKTTDFAETPTPDVNNEPNLANQYWAARENQIVIGQMYVQFLIPASANKNSIPVINVHGSTHTGAALESTPDGREGWGPYMARHGIPTYIVDQPGRGRSGFDQSVVHEAESLIDSSAADAKTLLPTIGRITSNGAWTAWFGHIYSDSSCSNPGTSVANNRSIYTSTLYQHGELNCDPGNTAGGFHPPGTDYLPAFPINAIDPGITNLSNMPPNLAPLAPFADAHLGAPTYGPDAYYQLQYYKQLVPNMEATLPSSICNSCTFDPVGGQTSAFNATRLLPANTWSPFDLALLVEKLGSGIIATHSQSGIQGHHAVRNLKQRGSLSKLKALVTIEGGCSFNNSGLTAADFDNVAYLAVVGDYTADSATCIDSVNKINARRALGLGTAKAEYIKLDSAQINSDGRFNGTTHMMMLGTNHLKVADVILNWTKEYVKK